MYCKRCEKYLEPNETVCPICGTKVKLKKILKTIYIAVGLVGIITISIILLWKNYSANKERENLNNQQVEIIKINKNNYITFGKNTFKLAEGLQYSNNENYIYAATPNLNISFKMNTVTASYINIKDKLKNFVESLVENGTQVVSYYVNTYENKEYILIATIQNNKNCLYVITELNSSTIVQSVIESTTNSNYEIAIQYLNTIIKNYIQINFDLGKEYTATLNDFLNTNNSNINLEDLFKGV